MSGKAITARLALPLSLLLALSGLVLPSVAAAEEADALYEEGMVRFKVGRFEESQELLERAAAQAKEGALGARIQLQLGVVAGVLKEDDRAAAAFRKALGLDPALVLEKGRIKARVIEIFERVRKELSGTVKVRAGRDGLAVLLDGSVLGKTPLEATVPAGRHKLEVLSESKEPLLAEEFVVGAREVRSFEVRLAQAPASQATEGGKPAPGRRWPVFTLAAAGAAVAVAAVALGLGLSARSGYSEYETTRDPARYQELADSVPARATGANICFGVAGALAAASVVLYFLVDRRAAAAASDPGAAPATKAGLSLRALSLRYSF
jgi:tetratricopeptide (TPR) repeat protein